MLFNPDKVLRVEPMPATWIKSTKCSIGYLVYHDHEQGVFVRQTVVITQDEELAFKDNLQGLWEAKFKSAMEQLKQSVEETKEGWTINPEECPGCRFVRQMGGN